MNLQDFEYDSNGVEIQFKGNTRLKGSGINLPYTKEHISEYIKCANDWKYFAKKYYYVYDVDGQMIKPKIRDYQTDLITSYIDNRYTIVLSSRQSGKSTSFEIFINWTILFQKDMVIAILANKAEQSREILMRIKNAYEMLPKWLQQGVKIWNVGSIKLENGCRVISSSTNSSAIRGRAISMLIIDERAFIDNKMWDSFIASVYPTISSGKKTKVIYVSTFNGLNHFYKDWEDALVGKNKFNPIRIDWWQVPGRDEAWKEETIANIGQIRFNQEYANKALGSISTLIEAEIITELKHKEPFEFSNILSKLNERLHRYCRIYEEPKKGHNYVIGVDSAKMTEDNAGDALGMQVLDITSFPIKQVATFFVESGLSYLQSPDVVVKLGNYYNNAIVFIENNEIGQEVANMVHFDYEYENTYWEKSNLPGFRTTKKTKRIGCSNLKLLIENNKLVINDFDTISQLSTFIRKKVSYCAESGYQDDLVMALISAIFFLQTSGLDIDIIENTTDLGKKILSDSEFIKDEDEPLFGILPDDEYEVKTPNDFDWLT